MQCVHDLVNNTQYNNIKDGKNESMNRRKSTILVFMYLWDLFYNVSQNTRNDNVRQYIVQTYKGYKKYLKSLANYPRGKDMLECKLMIPSFIIQE